MSRTPSYLLPTIIFAQFAGTSLWFAGNAVLPDLQQALGLSPEALGWITSSVQLGLISGTLGFATIFYTSSPEHSKGFYWLSSDNCQCAGIYPFYFQY